MNEKIEFEYGGRKYAMTSDELEAAYRYKEKEYRREDALRQLNNMIFGDYEVDDEETSEDKKAHFESLYHVSYEQACEMVDDFVDVFEDFEDCNVDENQTWEDAITEVLEEVKKNAGKTGC